MEDETIEKSAKLSTVLMAVGVLGFIFGLTAIALSLSAMVKVGDASKDMSDRIEKTAALALDMKKMGDKVDALAAQIEAIKGGDNSRVDALSSQVKAAVEKIGTIISENRKLIEENRAAIEKVARLRSGGAAVRTGPVQVAGNSSSPASSESGASSEATVDYKIQAGDTISKIAPKFGVSVDAVLSANPDVNPSRLRVGQVIKIPKK